MSGTNEVRIVVLGKTGDGKSSTANTIYGEKIFSEKLSPCPDTRFSISETKVRSKNLTIVDTPGFLNPELTDKALELEIKQSIFMCAPGPHVFILILRAGTYTGLNAGTADMFKRLFGDNALKYTIICFTHGDQLKDKQTIEDIVTQNAELQSLVYECGGRCHVIDNKYWNQQKEGDRSNKVQIQKLLNAVDELIRENGGSHYTNEMLKEHENVMQKRGLEKTLRIVLLGKSGCGKSSTGNTILELDDEHGFSTSDSPNSNTGKCESKCVIRNGTEITVTDTPGIFDNRYCEKEVTKEILRCITECAPGPHAFLITLKVDRFTEQEREILKKIENLFSSEALKYSVIVFTCGDQLKKGWKIEDFVCQCDELKSLVSKCGGGCQVIDNRYWNMQQDGYRNNKFQVQRILNTIQNMVRKNAGRYYTNEFLKKVQEKIDTQEIILRSKSTPNMSNSDFRYQARSNVFAVLLVEFLGIALLALLALFLK